VSSAFLDLSLSLLGAIDVIVGEKRNEKKRQAVKQMMKGRFDNGFCMMFANGELVNLDASALWIYIA